MEIQPIFSALRKHKVPATLIVLEIALACAVLCNAVFMIGHRIGEMRIPNAIDENGIVSINVDGADPKLESADIPANLAALRGIPGVTAAAAINMVPLSNGNMTVNSAAAALAQFISRKGIQMVAPYAFTSGGPAALGLQLLRGRFFSSEEYAGGSVDDTGTPTSHVVVITQHLAQRLWPGHNALGRQVYFYPTGHYTVIGVVANVLLPAVVNGPANFANATFFPASSANNGMGMRNYILRTAPQNRERVLHEAVAKLRAASPDAVVKGQTFTQIRDKYFADTRSMVWMLVQVCIVMLLVTAFSIVGLSSFWVGQRRRQIGIRRALGARRAQIAQYFQTENFLLSTAGVVVGMILAYGANLYLMAHYQLDRMPWYYLPASAVVLWMLGQLAVLGPALRAAAVPPVVATRSV
ncbi:MAG TPA: FtsX-like permease family protein [Rhodanobacteraceae bacterium]|nr:FtsX-like permease family protein [Rhodanobacteraceae bacterium]